MVDCDLEDETNSFLCKLLWSVCFVKATERKLERLSGSAWIHLPAGNSLLPRETISKETALLPMKQETLLPVCVPL